MVNREVKISELARSVFVSTAHKFFVVRDGGTVLSTWGELSDDDVLVFSQGSETFGTTFAEMYAILTGDNVGPQTITPTAGSDSDPIKFSQLNRADYVSSTGLFVVADPGVVAQSSYPGIPSPNDYTAITAAKTKAVTFGTINSLLSPGVLDSITLYPISYADDAAASTGGVAACGLYRIDQGNAYGVPSPLGATLVRNATGCGEATYANQAAAVLGGVPLGGVYGVTQGNDYGIIGAGGRGVAVVTSGTAPNWKGPFASFAAAAAGGVVLNEAFLVAASNELGVISTDNVPIVRVQ